MQLLHSRIFNLLAFNLIWAGCVIGREQLLWLVGPVTVAYVSLLLYAGTLRLRQIAIPFGLGVSVDSILTLAGVFQFDSGPLLPIWLVVLWLGFATTLCLSLTFLGRSRSLAILAGALAFPFNYAVGERFGAVDFIEPYFAAILAMSLVWAALLPVLIHFANQNPVPQDLPRGRWYTGL